jgi:hypothetical protein
MPIINFVKNKDSYKKCICGSQIFRLKLDEDDNSTVAYIVCELCKVKLEVENVFDIECWLENDSN